MSSGGPTRTSDSLADVVEMLLDKGVVVNADIVVSVGDTELLGVQLRAAIASFETAAEYGLEFPEGTDMRRVEAASGRSELEEGDEDEDTVQTAIAEAGETVSEPASETEGRADPGVRVRPAGIGGDEADETGEESKNANEDDKEDEIEETEATEAEEG